MADTDSFAKQFAVDILQAIRSGPLPNPEQIITTLSEMVITLAEDNKALHELCAARQETVDGASWIIEHANLIKA
jgi:hypothetical protein